MDALKTAIYYLILNNDFDSECFDDRYFYYQSEQGEGWANYGMVQFFKRQVYV